MGTITNKQLVTYARGQLGRPYWYSCFGQRGTRELYAEVAKRYPSQIYKWPKETYMAQLGQKVHDCSGLVKGACYCDGDPDGVPKYDSAIDLSANGMIEACTVQGDFDTIPEVPGLLVWKSGHVGVFVQTLADGKKLVYESKGHMFGVCATTETKWKKWGKLPFIKYDTNPEGDTCMVELAILKRGMKDTNGPVTSWQGLLRLYGYTDDTGAEIKPDGSFGPKTEQATKKVQKKHGLTITGVVNSAEWHAIIM